MKANSAHRYTVELRIWGHFDAATVTAETRLHPCDVSKTRDAVNPRSVWAFNGGGDSGEYEWSTLEEGLTFVLDRVGDAAPLFKEYARQHLVSWWCGHFKTSIDGGPTLSPELLRRLGDFGADLFIDNYQVDEEQP
jgi:hypothetical protein